MRTRMRRWAAVLTIVLGVAFLAPVGIHMGSSPSVSAQGAGRERVTIGVVDNLLSALSMVAIGRGFYTKNGLDAELKVFRSGQEVAKALAAGDITIGSSAMNNFQSEIQAGLEQVAYIVIMGDGASRDNDRPLAITAAPGTNVRKPEDLKGKTVGLSLGGTAEMYLRAVLEKVGLSADKDYRMVQVVPANSAAAMRTRQVDAISAWEPWNTQILKEVTGSVEVARGGGYFNYVIFGLTKRNTLRDRPDLVKRVIRGQAEAALFIRQHPKEAAAAIGTWLPGLNTALFEEGLKNVPFDVRVTPFTRIAWDQSYHLLSRWGRLKGPVPMQGWVDTKLLNEVVQETPRWFADLKPAQLLELKMRETK